MPPRLSEETKRVRGTDRRRPEPPSVGTPRLQKAIEPPADLSPELAREWRLHMALVLRSGRMSFVDLAMFLELCRASHLVGVAYQAAVQEGPTTVGSDGSAKSGAAFRSYLAASALYSRLLS